MKWLLNFSTRAKLFVGFGVMLAMLLVAIFTAYAGITAIEKVQKGLYEQDFANAVDLLKLRADQNGMRTAMLTMRAMSQRSDQEAEYQDAKTRHGLMLGSLQRLLERNRDNAQKLQKLEEYKVIYEAFSRTRDEEIVPMIYAGNTAQAATLAHGIQEERYHQMRGIATDLGTEAEENARAAVAASSQDTRKAKSVSDSVQKVSQVSLAGRKSVEGVAQGMLRIQEQVGSVAESIVGLSEQSQAIGEIITTVNDAAQAAAQIAASSQQQLVGMDQVALAMRNIDQASAQNVAGTQQVKATAQTLHELGQKLKELTGQYQV